MGIDLRRGSFNDSEWIVKLLHEGARDGHYGPSMTFQAEELIRSIFETGGVQMIKLRGEIQTPTFIKSTITVAEVDGYPASFLVCCEENNEIEIHLAGTVKKYRRKGCFNELMNKAISDFKGSKIYARCYKKSSWAINGLRNLNFEITKRGDPVELTHCK